MSKPTLLGRNPAVSQVQEAYGVGIQTPALLHFIFFFFAGFA